MNTSDRLHFLGKEKTINLINFFDRIHTKYRIIADDKELGDLKFVKSDKNTNIYAVKDFDDDEYIDIDCYFDFDNE